MKPYFSIIVPVYNSSQYLHRCIESILNQTYKDFECILVDDGSTDDSGLICDTYKQKDKRVRVYHKENGGVSSARNKGIKEAKGNYVIFVDSDDYILEDKLEKVYLNSLQNPDMLVGYYKIPESYRYVVHEITEKDFFHINNIGVVWTSVYNNKILKENSICFDESIWHGEDSIFILNYFLHCKNIVFIDDHGYIYEKGHVNGLNAKFQSCIKELYTYNTITEYRNEIYSKIKGDKKIYFKIKKGEIIRIVKSIYLSHDKLPFRKRINFIKSILYKYDQSEISHFTNKTDKIIIKCLNSGFLIPLDFYMTLWKAKINKMNI